MQATITYRLTEQAQRAQMAATGQPVARKQTVIVDVTAADLPLCTVAEDGSLSVDTTRYRAELIVAGWDNNDSAWATVYAPDVLADIRRGRRILDAAYADACAIASQHVLDTPALMMDHPELSYRIEIPHVALAKSAVLQAHPRIEQKWSGYGIVSSDLSAKAQATLTKRYAAETIRVDAERSAAIDAWIANPEGRAKLSYRGEEVIIRGVKIPREYVRYQELYAEIERRNSVDAEAKAAKDAAQEQLKADAIAAFVAASGDKLLQEQHASDLLCRKTIIRQMADAALDAAGLPPAEQVPVVCDETDCPCRDTEIDCIPPVVFARWKAIGPLPDDHDAEFHEVRNCLSDEQGESYDRDTQETAGPTEYHAIVTIPSGPFRFVRRIKI